ncbi:beta-1,3-galactosyltransferase brn [Ceratina calcarata]|uniref:Hexosyltransferase n=1 Tax=Ceratina calcarata TaxID=156304 RepID=A0AAJ7N9N3_9HYME|nr:beta-1,3-galactosyltransferase brn [Ceratina calcarata]
MYCLLRPCFQKSLHLATKIKLKYVCLGFGFIVLLDFFGAFTHLFEIPYDSKFAYPYEGDVHEFVNALRNNEKPVVDPINEYKFAYLIDNQQKCVDVASNTFRVVYVIKSSVENFERRSTIRKTWGFENRFFDVPSKTIFILGNHPHDDELQAKVKIEAAKYKDIVQADFMDSYYNNTTKTMMGFKWLVKYCTNSKFYMFVDDDMYVSVKNVLRFIRNPANYPDYLKEPKKFDAHKREIKETDEREDSDNDTSVYTIHGKLAKRIYPLKQDLYENTTASVNDTKQYSNLKLRPFQGEILKDSEIVNRTKRQIFDFELPEDVRLFAGFVFVSSPHRHKSSKWYISLSEYPYHLWPPYVTAGAYILSKEALLDMYYTSLYTKHFKFDDIFLGLVAKKAEIEPFHCEEFHFYKKDYTKFNYKYVITSHGYGDPNELLTVWNEQKALGNA